MYNFLHCHWPFFKQVHFLVGTLLALLLQLLFPCHLKLTISISGVKKNGSVSHFFHRTFKAYNTGNRKRRKINTDDLADVRWHKTGKTKPVLVDGKHLGCKKIMVLYMSTEKGGKPEKTNWVMHQYHLGTGEDEKEGEYVVSKLFFQQQFKPGEKNAQELTTGDAVESMAAEADAVESMAAEADASDFTTLPFEEHVSTIQEVVHNLEHNPYQVTRILMWFLFIFFVCGTQLFLPGFISSLPQLAWEKRLCCCCCCCCLRHTIICVV